MNLLQLLFSKSIVNNYSMVFLLNLYFVFDNILGPIQNSRLNYKKIEVYKKGGSKIN